MATAPPSKNDISGSGSTPSNAQARAGFGAIHDNLYGVDGLLGSTGLTADARKGLGIGSVISFRNLLINGNFSINQRVYGSGVATTSGNQYTLDRWRVVTSGQNLSFGAASPDRVVTAPAGGIEQVVEGANMVGGVYTLSWVGTATATVNGAAVTNGGQTAALTAGVNATIKFSGGTVDRAQFELGEVATPFERRPIGLERMLAYRYFQTSYVGVAAGTGDPTGRISVISFDGGTGVTSSPVFLPVEMRTTPTVTIYNSTTGASGSMRNEETGVDIPAVLGSGAGPKYFRVLNNNTTLFPRTLSYHYTASAEL